ncbi:MAG: cache domain-containing protein [Desulfobacterales bacterium]|nr:cache domain-containing protein [Desulfobacterales bacterium]
MNRFFKYFRDRPIGLKLFYTYSLIVLVAVFMVGISAYYIAGKTIKQNIESKLSNATDSILNMVETTAQASIKNYLRAVAEKNLEIASFYHSRVKQGQISEQEAKDRLKQIFLGQTIGNTGYIYCLDSNGIAVMHPDPLVEDVDFSHFAFIQSQMKRKQGYLEYEWKNPGEENPRPKAMYMTYFEPWDWVISVSSYRSEFARLINISDFKDNILAQTFGKTGYSYILESNGDIVVHPHLSGNLWDAVDADGYHLVRHQCRTKNGKLFYSWRNPGEEIFREKLVIYNYIPEYDWIVSSTGYLEEFYAPLNSVRNIVVGSVLLIFTIMLPVTFTFARSITRPLYQLEKNFSQGAAGNFTGRMESRTKDEIGKLALYFNQFMDRLESYSTKIRAEIEERRKTEELFSKAFHSSPSGIFIANLNNNRFIDANQSFLKFTGCHYQDVIGKSISEFSLFVQFKNFEQITNMLEREGRIRDMDVEFVNSENKQRLGTVNAELINIWGQRCMLCSLEDLTETKRLEREIIEISESERLQLGQYLHDDLRPHLMGIEVLQKVLRQKLVAKGYTDIAPVDKLRELVREAVSKSGRISRGLCPTHIADQALELTLEELCRDIEQIYNVSCNLKHEGPSIQTGTIAATHIFYIAREAAYNAVRHGKAQNIWISISGTEEKVLLQVHDDGNGLPDKIDNQGMGIRIMHYRARRIGGVLDIRKDQDKGTCVILGFNPHMMIKEQKNAFSVL